MTHDESLNCSFVNFDNSNIPSFISKTQREWIYVFGIDIAYHQDPLCDSYLLNILN